MSLVSKIWFALLLAVQFVVGAAARLLWALIGRPRWELPAWPAHVWHGIWARPGRTAGALVVLALVGATTHWYVNRPQPPPEQLAQLEIVEPTLTRYDRAPIQVAPLRVRFSRSVAPLAQVDKAAEAISMTPEIAGSWRWEGDRELVFQPQGDWPAAQRYSVQLDAEQTVAALVLLERDHFEFSTSRFLVSSGSAEFYQDPQQATLKKGIFNLRFSHPVDPASLERAVSLQLSDGGKQPLPAPAFTVNYDEYKLQAWVHSAPLELPANGGSLQLLVADGVQGLPPGARAEGALQTQVALPALYSLTATEMQAVLVENDRFEPEQALVLAFSFAVRDRDVQQAVQAWVLPRQNPKQPQQQRWNWSAEQVTEEVLQAGRVLPLEPIAAEREYIEAHSFRYSAEPGEQIYVRVAKGLDSFGGYKLGQNAVRVLSSPNYPQLLKFVADGSLLSLRGERKLSVVSRNVPGLRLEVSRILPEQLQHLVHYNNGSYSQPELYSPGVDELSERFEHSEALPTGSPAKAHYAGLDLGQFLSAGKRGVFVLQLMHFDPAQPERRDSQTDRRLVVLTDLGLIVKRQKDGSRVAFVASLASGEPVAGATVSVIGANGEPVLSDVSDADGRADLADISGFERERNPVMIIAKLGDDLSFLPIHDGTRDLDLSRFPIEGDVNPDSAGTLDAHLFSDRGLYRPGDTMNFGLIVKAADWQTQLSGLPVEVELVDPQGNTLLDQAVKLGPLGFEELSYTTSDSSSTGSYTLTLYRRISPHTRIDLGYTTVQVKEFLPDRMKVKATLSASTPQGWVKPDGLSARVDVANLFGTPAQDRRVTANLLLQPFWPRFAQYPDHQFFDPRRADESFSEALSDGQTNAEGVAEFELPLSAYADATFELRFNTQAFEAGGGRSVAAETSVLVSANDFLLGIRNATGLDYLKRGEQRSLEVLAVDPQLRPLALSGIKAVLIEQRYVSLLTKQSSGAWKYESQLREHTLSSTALEVPALASGAALALATDQPGNFRLDLRDSTDKLLNQVRYTVAGNANLSRSMERNAELQLKLAKGEYAAGEQLELSITAPYTGSGLITIEREQVFAHRWFRSDTLSSVQTITVPEGLEAGAYVHVQFVRDPDSPEVHTSPLSYAVAPFTINRAARTADLQLQAPKRIRPGETLKIRLDSKEPVRAAVFVVDMGILQVARYTLADPLDQFLRKRALEVSTAQILDLLLPEFSRLAALAAPGGDDDGSAGRNLNPFKRKRDKPAVHWFGLHSVHGGERFEWTVPDTFNGALKVMVVAVGAQQIGIAQAQTEVRGEFVLSPNVPTTVAPGDRFEVSLGVADNREEPGVATQPVQLELKVPAQLRVIGEALQTQNLKPGSESVVIWQLEALEQLGTPELSFSASAGSARVQQKVGLSLRPAIARQTVLTTGRMTGSRMDLSPNRELWDEFAQREVGASRLPVVLLDGLSAYLDDFPHRCTEQLLSQALPGLVYASHPELGKVSTGSSDPHAAVLDVLLGRQNGDGAFGLWQATLEVDPFITNYAVLYLLEARDRGQRIPAALLERANAYLRTVAADPALSELHELRMRAFAVYLLTRQGEVTSNALLSLRQQLDADHPGSWSADSTALLLAASYAGLKQDAQAVQLIGPTLDRLRRAPSKTGVWVHANWHDPLVADALSLYLLHKHFTTQARELPARVMEHLLGPIAEGRYNTLSSALSVLAIEAYAAGNPDAPAVQLYGVAADGSSSLLEASAGLVQRATYTSAARSLRLENTAGGGAPVWYMRSERGFDRNLAAAAQHQSIEIQREYLNEQGTAVSKATLGEELTVRLRLRATGNQGYANIAIIDLLPGGFEIVEPQPDEDGNLPPRVQSTDWVEHVDGREDRMLIYTQANTSVAEYRYRIKATAAGQFVVPPAYAESMYQLDVRSRAEAGARLEVLRP